MSDYRERCLKQKINVCNLCGSTKDLIVHHIDGDRDNNSLSNLLPVCRECHEKIHKGMQTDNELIAMFKDKLPSSAIHEGPYSNPQPEITEPWDSLTCITTVNEDGWLTIPKQSRRTLGIDGESANVNLKVEVIEE